MVYDGQIELEEVNEEYKTFVDKFKPKKTTDDCYTPPLVFEAIQNWTCKRYGIKEEQIVRPFYPGEDYRKFDYAPDAVVLDNPPFSILTEIANFYNFHGVKFFLFGPALTILSGFKEMKSCAICVGASITYENGANVPTSFITNMDNKYIAYSCPELFNIIKEINAKNQKEKKQKAELPKYDYPDYVVTAAKLQYYSAHHTDFAIRKRDAIFIRELDAQKAKGKTIFGSGLLLSEKAAAEKAAAEKAAAEKWELSERELEIVRMIGERNGRGG